MSVIVAKVKDKNKLQKKAFERIKESKWGTANKSMLIKHPRITSHILHSELA